MNSVMPYLDAAFQRAQQIATNDLMCYVNADIIFPPNLVESISSIPFQKFLGVGRSLTSTSTISLIFRTTNLPGSSLILPKIRHLNSSWGLQITSFSERMGSLNYRPLLLDDITKHATG